MHLKIAKLMIVLMSSLVVASPNIAPAQRRLPSNGAARFDKSLASGNYADVERAIMDYAIANPSDARAIETLGRLRLAQGRISEATSLFQRATVLDPRSASARINLAMANIRGGNTDRAQTMLAAVSEGDLTSETLRFNFAETLALAGNCPDALKNIDKLPAGTKIADVLSLRAECYVRTGESAKAIELIPNIVPLSKRNPAAAIKFADALAAGGKFREAAGVLRAVIVAAPQSANAYISLARTEINLRDFANAELHLRRAAEIDSRAPDLLLLRAQLEDGRGNAALSLASLEKALAANPSSADVLRLLIVAAMRANNGSRAFEAAENLLEIKPDDAETLYLHGAAALQSNNLAAAETSLARYAEMRPRDSRGCLALGLTFAAQPLKLENAREQLRKCIEIDPKNFEAKYQLGLSYNSQGETREAIKYLEAAVADSPNYASALRDLGAAYLQSGSEAKARSVLEKAVAINAKDAETHFQLSRLYSLLGETELAKKHLTIFQQLKSPAKNGM